MKKIIANVLLALMLSTTGVMLAHATDFDFIETFNDFGDSIGEVSTDIEDNVDGIELPTYQEQGDDGTTGIVNTIFRALDFLKLILGAMAVTVTVFTGIRLVGVGRDNEQVAGEAKSYIAFALEGLVVVFAAEAAVYAFFGAEGEVFRGGVDGAVSAADRVGAFFEGLYNLAQVIIGSVAVFVIITAGFRYVGGSYNDDQIATAKRQIQWALIGLFIVGMSELFVKDILFKDQGTELGIQSANTLFSQITNFVAGTLGTFGFVMVIYAGYLYVTARENEDQVAKAKKILIGAFIGLIMAGAAFAFTNTLVELDASR